MSAGSEDFYSGSAQESYFSFPPSFLFPFSVTRVGVFSATPKGSEFPYRRTEDLLSLSLCLLCLSVFVSLFLSTFVSL